MACIRLASRANLTLLYLVLSINVEIIDLVGCELVYSKELVSIKLQFNCVIQWDMMHPLSVILASIFNKLYFFIHAVHEDMQI